MNLGHNLPRQRQGSIPRVSGGEPIKAVLIALRLAYSPRERG